MVTVKLFDDPSTNDVEAADVMPGAWSTVSVNDWLASGLTPFVALMVSGYVPPVPAAGVPDRVAVPLAWATKVTPAGRDPVLETVAAGLPVVITVKLPEDPTVKVVEDADVIAGAASTVKVNDWVAFGLTPFEALKVGV